jgi:hypothetical protein
MTVAIEKLFKFPLCEHAFLAITVIRVMETLTEILQIPRVHEP